MRTSVLPAVPVVVAAFAAQAGVSEYLPGVLEMTRRVFPDAPLRLLVEDDPEIPDHRHLVVEIVVTISSPEEVNTAEWRWCQEIFRHCPATHAAVFCLGLVPAS